MDEKTTPDQYEQLDQILHGLSRDVARDLVMGSLALLVEDMVRDPSGMTIVGKINTFGMIMGIQGGLSSRPEIKKLMIEWSEKIHDLIVADLQAAGLAK